MTITKIEIYQFYMLNDDEWIGKFIIDLEEKTARWDLSFENDNQYPIEHYSNNYLNEIRNNVSNKIYKLSDNKIKDFLEKLNDFKDIVRPNLQVGFPKVTHGCYFVFFTESSSFVSYFLNKFTSNWVDFSILIENLVGFDVLNINYSKKFITNICYNIQKEGIYDAETKRKLNLKKINFKHFPIDISRGFTKFSIDFNESKMFHLFDDNSIFSSQVLTDFELNTIKDLLIQYDVYLWDNLRYWPFYNGPCCTWDIELVFDNDAVFHIGSSKNYPTQYLSLGMELFNLLGKDLFKLFEITNTRLNSKYKELFKKDIFKSSFIIGMNLAKFDLIKENAVDIAKTMYNDEWSIKNISNVTSLSHDEIISHLGLDTSI